MGVSIGLALTNYDMEVNKMSEDKISVGEVIVATLGIGAVIMGALKTMDFVKKSGGIKPATDKVVAKVITIAALGKGVLSDKETRLNTIKDLKKKVDEKIAKGKEAADNKSKEEKKEPEKPKETEFEVVTGKVEHVAPDGKDVLETGTKQFVGYIPKGKTEGLKTGMMGDAIVTGNTNYGVGIIINGGEMRVAGTVAIEGIQAELEPLVGVTGLKFVLEEEPDNKEDEHAIKVYLTV